MNECSKCGDYCESIQNDLCDSCYEEEQKTNNFVLCEKCQKSITETEKDNNKGLFCNECEIKRRNALLNMGKTKPTKEEFKKQLLEKIHFDLCHLEDLTDYKIKNISKSVNLIQKVKL